MKFYIDIVSLLFLGLIYLTGTAVLGWFGPWLRKRWKGAWMLMVPLFLLLYIGPVAEELWIAWNFGRLCRKDAGLAVYKIVEVDGFYDAYMRSGFAITKRGDYRFVEHATADTEGVERVERADEALRNQALAWYARTNPGKERPQKRAILYPLNDKEIIEVAPNGVDAWKVTKLDRPEARYHFTTNKYGTSVAHKITRWESLVSDQTSAEILGRYVEYARRPAWFFVAVGEVPFSCDGPDGGPSSKRSALIYKDVLIPR